jgi:hypothetical protein
VRRRRQIAHVLQRNPRLIDEGRRRIAVLIEEDVERRIGRQEVVRGLRARHQPEPLLRRQQLDEEEADAHPLRQRVQCLQRPRPRNAEGEDLIEAGRVLRLLLEKGAQDETARRVWDGHDVAVFLRREEIEDVCKIVDRVVGTDALPPVPTEWDELRARRGDVVAVLVAEEVVDRLRLLHDAAEDGGDGKTGHDVAGHALQLREQGCLPGRIEQRRQRRWKERFAGGMAMELGRGVAGDEDDGLADHAGASTLGVTAGGISLLLTRPRLLTIIATCI